MERALKQLLKQFIMGKLSNYYWEIYGRTINNPPLPPDPKTFLFVCTGNICRSPFAEHLAVTMARQKDVNDKEFSSVGLDVTQSFPPPGDAVSAALRFHVDLRAHRSSQMTYEMLQSFDMILMMEASHFNFLCRNYPVMRNKIFLLPLFDNKKMSKYGGYLRYNILDPYGKSVDEFLVCYERIHECISGLFLEMQASASSARVNL